MTVRVVEIDPRDEAAFDAWFAVMRGHQPHRLLALSGVRSWC
jgi:hypothetical protein